MSEHQQDSIMLEAEEWLNGASKEDLLELYLDWKELERLEEEGEGDDEDHETTMPWPYDVVEPYGEPVRPEWDDQIRLNGNDLNQTITVPPNLIRYENTNYNENRTFTSGYLQVVPEEEEQVDRPYNSGLSGQINKLAETVNEESENEDLV